jgi:DNA-binding NarL/FixJ family response regulator
MAIVLNDLRSNVIVVGEPSIARDLIGLVLDSYRIVDDLASPRDDGNDDPIDEDWVQPVAVLVDPTPRHFSEATAAGLPIVVVATEALPDDALAEAILGGADAVVSPAASADYLRAAVAAVAAGGVVLDAHQARVVVEAARRSRTSSGTGSALSGRELDILRSIARGESVKQTARTLGIRPKTVENVQSRLFRKLNVRNRAQAVSRAYSLGLLTNGVHLDA